MPDLLFTVQSKWLFLMSWRLFGNRASANIKEMSLQIRNVRAQWSRSGIARWMPSSWWHHQMETFSALLALRGGSSPVTGEFPAQRPVTQSFDIFFDLRLNKRLSKQSRGWWFETPSRSFWHNCNDLFIHLFWSYITGIGMCTPVPVK